MRQTENVNDPLRVRLQGALRCTKRRPRYYGAVDIIGSTARSKSPWTDRSLRLFISKPVGRSRARDENDRAAVDDDKAQEPVKKQHPIEREEKV